MNVYHLEKHNDSFGTNETSNRLLEVAKKLKSRKLIIENGNNITLNKCRI